jgi:2,2-dialkylglycine decarboxylase (pyruvate)
MSDQHFDTEALRRAGERYLVRTRLLTDIIPDGGGPVLERAEGSRIWDTDGKVYLDFNSGQMCSALGHNNPRVARAVSEGMSHLTHCSSTYYNVPQVQLAEKLASTLPAPLTRSMFIQSGADSNEAAVLFARRATGRSGVGAFSYSFHGYSDATRAMSFIGGPGPGYGPSFADVHAIPTPYTYRPAVGDAEADPEWWRPLIALTFEVLDRQSPNNLAAIIAEPLISAGGVIELPPGYLQALRDELHARGALLILDEAQTGLGKLGTMYGHEHHGVVPDIMTLSKHFGGGIALSAVITSDEIEERATAGGLNFGHSHSSDPISCTAGLASLEEIIEENLTVRAKAIGVAWQSRMVALQQRHAMVGDVRGRGCLQGVELVRDRATKEPASAEAARVLGHCLGAGLLFSVRGPNSNVLRFVPPFTTTDADLDEAADILEEAIAAAG